MNNSNVLATDFVKTPALYLDRVKETTITIIQEGNPIALLVNPIHTNPSAANETSLTPITDSLTGLLKNTGIETKDLVNALMIPIEDYEDALQANCAEKICANVIVTRDLAGFGCSKIQVITPDDV